MTCAKTLSSLGLVMRLYGGENSGQFPVDLRSLSNELATTKFFVCPSDQLRVPAPDWASVGPANISYEYLALGLRESALLTNVLFRCPIHHYIIFEDGGVRKEQDLSIVPKW